MTQKTQLATTELGTTGMEITRVGLGAWAIGGNGYEYAWGPQDDDKSLAAIDRAIELGINWIDTAAGYGLGHSELVVGRALAGVTDRPYVFTKASLLDGGNGKAVHNLQRDAIWREAEASLSLAGSGRHRPLPDPLADSRPRH